MSPQYQKARQKMVTQLRRLGIKNKRVLEAMSLVPREKFVPQNIKKYAHLDTPLPIGHGQTISQPYVVARMCELLELDGHEKVLDIGTGSGYQAAVLSLLAKEVHSLEIISPLAKKAQKTLSKLGFQNVIIYEKDAKNGLPEHAPFDAIKSAATSHQIPQAWKKQLKTGGRIVAPIKSGPEQKLIRLTKDKKGFQKEEFDFVRFVPLI
jgi:protein-L-isoaspartate(D-aspartate) O-methyltransferase